MRGLGLIDRPRSRYESVHRATGKPTPVEEALGRLAFVLNLSDAGLDDGVITAPSIRPLECWGQLQKTGSWNPPCTANWSSGSGAGGTFRITCGHRPQTCWASNGLLSHKHGPIPVAVVGEAGFGERDLRALRDFYGDIEGVEFPRVLSFQRRSRTGRVLGLFRGTWLPILTAAGQTDDNSTTAHEMGTTWWPLEDTLGTLRQN